MGTFYVYIHTNNSRTLYVGMTNDLERRMFEHKTKAADGFTAKYNITRLVYHEETNDPVVAIEREKQIKGWLRQKKIDLVESENPNWLDLAADWFTPEQLKSGRRASYDQRRGSSLRSE